MKSGMYAAFLAAGLVACAAQAEECKPLQMLTSISLSTDHEVRRLYVPVEIAGKPMRLLLDTGAASSILTEKAAKELGLETRDAPVKAYDLTGTYTDRMTTAPLKLGRINFERVQFMVAPNLNGFDEPDVAGLLGANLLSRFDLSIDPANKKLDILSQDHCPDQVIYWPATAYSKIAYGSASGHIRVGVKLDGKPLKAIIDTGAWESTLHINSARHLFDITPGAPGTPEFGHLNGDKNLITYQHTFTMLDFEGVAVSNPNITLIPDMWKDKLTHVPTGSHIGEINEAAEAEILVGMNILRHLHIYIAYKEKAFYFTPAVSAPPQQATK